MSIGIVGRLYGDALVSWGMSMPGHWYDEAYEARVWWDVGMTRLGYGGTSVWWDVGMSKRGYGEA